MNRFLCHIWYDFYPIWNPIWVRKRWCPFQNVIDFSFSFLFFFNLIIPVNINKINKWMTKLHLLIKLKTALFLAIHSTDLMQKIKSILLIIFPIFIRISYVIWKNVNTDQLSSKTVFLKTKMCSIPLKMFRYENCQICKQINVLHISYI